MKNKLTEKDLNLIMSLVDGELNTTDQQKAKNLISSNSEAKKAYDDMKLSSNFLVVMYQTLHQTVIRLNPIKKLK